MAVSLTKSLNGIVKTIVLKTTTKTSKLNAVIWMNQSLSKILPPLRTIGAPTFTCSRVCNVRLWRPRSRNPYLRPNKSVDRKFNTVRLVTNVGRARTNHDLLPKFYSDPHGSDAD